MLHGRGAPDQPARLAHRAGLLESWGGVDGSESDNTFRRRGVPFRARSPIDGRLTGIAIGWGKLLHLSLPWSSAPSRCVSPGVELP